MYIISWHSSVGLEHLSVEVKAINKGSLVRFQLPRIWYIKSLFNSVGRVCAF